MEGGYTDLEMGQESAEGLELEGTWDPCSIPASPCRSPTVLFGRDITYLKLLAWEPSGNHMLTFSPRSCQVGDLARGANSKLLKLCPAWIQPGIDFFCTF